MPSAVGCVIARPSSGWSPRLSRSRSFLGPAGWFSWPARGRDVGRLAGGTDVVYLVVMVAAARCGWSLGW